MFLWVESYIAWSFVIGFFHWPYLFRDYPHCSICAVCVWPLHSLVIFYHGIGHVCLVLMKHIWGFSILSVAHYAAHNVCTKCAQTCVWIIWSMDPWSKIAQGTAQLFFKMVVPFYIHTSCRWSFKSAQLSRTLVILRVCECSRPGRHGMALTVTLVFIPYN